MRYFYFEKQAQRTSKPTNNYFRTFEKLTSRLTTTSESGGPEIGKVWRGCVGFWDPIFYKWTKFKEYDSKNCLQIGWGWKFDVTDWHFKNGLAIFYIFEELLGGSPRSLISPIFQHHYATKQIKHSFYKQSLHGFPKMQKHAKIRFFFQVAVNKIAIYYIFLPEICYVKNLSYQKIKKWADNSWPTWVELFGGGVIIDNWID